MKKKRWLYLVTGVVCVAILVVAGCAAENGAPPTNGNGNGNGNGEPTECPFVPEVCGMKEGEEDDYYYSLFGQLGSKSEYFDPIDWWANEVYERTAGHMEIELVYGSALGHSTEAPELIGAGVYNMGNYWPDYFPEKEPMGQMTMFPMIMFGKMDCALNGTRWFEYAHLHPLRIAEAQEAFNVHHMFVTGQRSYKIVFRTGQECYTTDDFKGKLMRGVAYYATWAEELGATPIFISYMEIYEALQKGMLDIAPVGYGSIETLRFCEVISMVWDMAIGAGDCSYSCNLDFWNDLPDYIQDIILDVAFELNYKHYWPWIQDGYDRVEPLIDEWDIEIYTPPKDVADTVAEAAKPALKAWVITCFEYGAPIEDFLWDCLQERHTLSGEEWPTLPRDQFDAFIAECKAEAGV
jgi:TRAP-type C4-dicarboxylate transport system substrate-binding protein